MSKQRRGSIIGWLARTYSKKKSAAPPKRRIGFECLEQRRLLSSVGLSTISNVTLAAGTSTLVALNGTDPGQTVHFEVTTSDPTKVSPVVMPQTNKSVQFNIDSLGTMTFQLFDNLTPNTATWIETLVNDGFYNGDYIYRAETGGFALIQGGNNPPQINSGDNVNPFPASFGTTTTINEEFNPDLNYTTAGTLAMARTGSPNSSSSEILHHRRGDTYLGLRIFAFRLPNPRPARQRPVDHRFGGDGFHADHFSKWHRLPEHTGEDQLGKHRHRYAERRLDAAGATGVTGTFTVTVTAYDSTTNTPTTKTFTVNVVADTATGQTTNPWACQTPAAPTSIAFQPQTGQGTTALTTANNSSASNKLQFLVSGITVGNVLTLYADGVAIGSTTATTTSQVVTTNGSFTLLDGMHTFTATQTLPGVTVSDPADSSQTKQPT